MYDPEILEQRSLGGLSFPWARKNPYLYTNSFRCPFWVVLVFIKYATMSFCVSIPILPVQPKLDEDEAFYLQCATWNNQLTPKEYSYVCEHCLLERSSQRFLSISVFGKGVLWVCTEQLLRIRPATASPWLNWFLKMFSCELGM